MNEKQIKKYTIGTIQSVKKHPELFTHYKVVIVDECFIAGTKIDGKNIEDVRVGDYVNSYNHTTNQIERKKVVSLFKKICPEKLYFTGSSCGSIISTGNHPVFIRGRGYTNAQDIKEGNIAYAIQGKISTNTNNSAMQILQKGDIDEIKTLRASTQDKKNISMLSIVSFRNNITDGVKNLFRKETPAFHKNKDIANPQENRTQTTSQRGERDGNDRARTNTNGRIRGWMESLCSKNGKKTLRWLSASLQNRPSEPFSQNSSRDRWEKSWVDIKTSPRQKKGVTIEKTRVDSVEVLKRGSEGKFNNGKKYDYVYNIEVEGNNNYFANNILVHNCHSINPKNLKGMYNTFFAKMGKPVIFGLTATAYRQAVYYNAPNGWAGYRGKIWQKAQLEAITTTKVITRFKERFWDRILYVVNTTDLQDKGLLCPLEYEDRSFINHEEIPTNITHSDFDLDAFEELISEKEQAIITQIKEIASEHPSVLVFCSSVEQAVRLSGVIPSSNYVEGTMSGKERGKTISGFLQAGGVLFNVGILTTGFDYPSLSAVVLLRPTRSLNLYNQMLGRLTRTAEGKTHGTVYDFSGTVKSLGRIESIKLTKIGGKWDIVSEKYPEGMHDKELYKYVLKKKKQEITNKE